MRSIPNIRVSSHTVPAEMKCPLNVDSVYGLKNTTREIWYEDLSDSSRTLHIDNLICLVEGLFKGDHYLVLL